MGLDPRVAGCIDIDLGLALRRLLPIRRLALKKVKVGRVTWLTFPEMTLALLPQSYAKKSEGEYLYESRGGAFSANLLVNKAGFVTHYPDLWEAEIEHD